MAITCLVSAADFARYFKGEGASVTPAWNGVERRNGSADRRAHQHDRRWEASRGRRARLSDRRRASR